MANARGRPRAFDRDTALQGALLLFWQQGLAATSLDELSQAMGMNRPSIYNAFGNKEAIYRLALAKFCAGLDDGLTAALDAGPDIRQGLIRFYDQALTLYCANTPSLGCLMICTAPTAALAHPEVGKDLANLIRRIDDQLTERVAAAIAVGEVSETVTPALSAKLLQATLHSLALRARAGESKRSLSKMARHAVALLLP